MTDSHKGAKIAGPKDRKNVISKISLLCDWEGCDKECKTLAGFKAHEKEYTVRTNIHGELLKHAKNLFLTKQE